MYCREGWFFGTKDGKDCESLDEERKNTEEFHISTEGGKRPVKPQGRKETGSVPSAPHLIPAQRTSVLDGIPAWVIHINHLI